MLNYLLDIDISPEEIYDINHELNKDIIASMELARNTVLDTLSYYKELGVNKLTNIIIYRPDLVLIKKKEVESLVSKIDKELFIKVVDNNIKDLIIFGI